MKTGACVFALVCVCVRVCTCSSVQAATQQASAQQSRVQGASGPPHSILEDNIELFLARPAPAPALVWPLAIKSALVWPLVIKSALNASVW